MRFIQILLAVSAIASSVSVAEIAGNDVVGTPSYPDQGMRQVSELGSQNGEEGPDCMVIDSKAGYAYLGTMYDQNYAEVLKIALGAGASPPTRVGTLGFGGDGQLSSAVIDPDAGYAYFGTYTSPGKIVKVALGNGNSLPTRVGSLTLNNGEDDLWSAVIDTAHGYAYFGTAGTPGQVVKVALGAGDSLPTRVGAVTLDSGENVLVSGIIDPGAGYAWFGTDTSPGRVVKVALGSGSNPPTRVGAVTLDSKENQLRCGLIDQAAGYGYFVNYDSEIVSRVIKVALGNAADPPTRVGALTLNLHEVGCWAGAIDPANGYAYFGTYSGFNNTSIIQVALGAGTAPPTRIGALPINNADNLLRCAVIDPAAGNLYFATNPNPGKCNVLKIGFSQKEYVKLDRLVMPEQGTVDKFSFYSHHSGGNVRIGLYSEDGGGARTLLWQSPSVANTVTNGFIDIPVGSGTPNQLTLQVGNYAIGWQCDSTAAVASYAAGDAGEGAYLSQPYGPFPAQIDAGQTTSTSERWTACLTYDPANVTPTPTSSPTPSPTLSPTPTPTPVPPTIDPIPDIIVGDAENGPSSNLFVYPDAIDVRNYVHSPRVPAAQVQWTFSTSGQSHYSINAHPNAYNTAVDPLHPSTVYSLTQGSDDSASADSSLFTLTFRNVFFSPFAQTSKEPGNPGTMQDAQTLTLTASDGVAYAVSNPFRVYIVNNGNDGKVEATPTPTPTPVPTAKAGVECFALYQ